ncbi:MAG: thioesterase family protein [Oligoflexus sp.]
MASISTDRMTMRGEHQLAIYYEDTDFSGFVYHSNYLKFFERAREHLIGIDFLKELYHKGIHFVVSEAQLNFKQPAKHGDQLIIRSEVAFSRSPILRASQQAFVRSDENETLLVVARIDLATLNSDNRPIRLPEFVMERFMEQQSLL